MFVVSSREWVKLCCSKERSPLNGFWLNCLLFLPLGSSFIPEKKLSLLLPLVYLQSTYTQCNNPARYKKWTRNHWFTCTTWILRLQLLQLLWRENFSPLSPLSSCCEVSLKEVPLLAIEWEKDHKWDNVYLSIFLILLIFSFFNNMTRNCLQFIKMMNCQVYVMSSRMRQNKSEV